LLSDPAVRQALNVLVDRSAVHEQIYGRQGQTSANFLNAPARVRSPNMRWEFNQNVVTIPVLWRNGVSVSALRLRGMDLSGWESTFWSLPFWYRQS